MSAVLGGFVADGLPVSLSEQGDNVGELWRVFLVIAVGVCLLVFGLVGWVVVRYRGRSDGLPPQTHYRVKTEVAYTAVPLVVVGALFALTVVSLGAIDVDASEPDLTVRVIGFQWQWRFEYPDRGAAVTGTGQDPAMLVLPADSTVRFELEAVDVIHSFWVPGFRYKRDLIPGSPGSFTVDVNDRVGTYAGYCAEFCGLAHADMTFTTRIVPRDEFDAWVAAQAEASP